MKRQRVLRGILAMGYSKIAIAVTQLAMVPVLATKWGVPQYGQWLLLSSVPAFLAAGDLGFGAAAGNRLIGEYARGDQVAARTTFQSALAVVVPCGVAVFFMVVAASALLPSSMLAVSGGMDSSQARQVLIVLSLWAVVAMQSSLFLAVMRAHGAFALSSTVEATVQLLEGCTVIGIASLGGSPFHTAFGLLAVRVVGVGCHVALALHRARWLSIGFRHASSARVKQLLRPAVAAMTLPLAQAGYLQGASLAVGAAAGAQAVPVVTSLRTLSRVAVQALLSVTVPVLPEFTSEHAKGNQPWVRRVAAAMVPFDAFLGAVAAAFLFFFGERLLAWWTNGSIVAPQSMITVTSVALVAAAVWNPMSNFLLAVNRHERFTYFFGLAASAALVLSYYLTDRWGVTGAAVANLALDLVMLICVLRELRRLVGPVGFSPLATIEFIAPGLQKLRRITSQK